MSDGRGIPRSSNRRPGERALLAWRVAPVPFPPSARIIDDQESLRGCSYLPFAFGVQGIIQNEFFLKDFMIAQAQGAEPVRNPSQSLACRMRIAGPRIRRADDFPE